MRTPDDLIAKWRADAQQSRLVGDSDRKVRDVMYEHARTVENMADELEAALAAPSPTPQEMLLVTAENIAREAHAQQKDTVTGEPYITHVERVVAMVESADEKAVAWLHDVVEDTDTSLVDLAIAGISRPVIDAVHILTREADVNYTTYIGDILGSGNMLARAVKVADLRDHLQPNCPARLRPRYEKALQRLSPTLPTPDPPTARQAQVDKLREYLKHKSSCIFGCWAIPSMCPICGSDNVKINRDGSSLLCMNHAAHEGRVWFHSVTSFPKETRCTCGLAEVLAVLETRTHER